MKASKAAKIVSALLLVGALAGCASAPKDPRAYYGPAPKDPEGQVKAWAETNLKDGESARYHFGTIHKAHFRDGLLAGGNSHYGWALSVDINAKNGYGAYGGYEHHEFFFQNEAIYSDDQPASWDN